MPDAVTLAPGRVSRLSFCAWRQSLRSDDAGSGVLSPACPLCGRMPDAETLAEFVSPACLPVSGCQMLGRVSRLSPSVCGQILPLVSLCLPVSASSTLASCSSELHQEVAVCCGKRCAQRACSDNLLIETCSEKLLRELAQIICAKNLLGELAQRNSRQQLAQRNLRRELARITWPRALLMLSGHPSSSSW